MCTKRTISPHLEDILLKDISVLDKGFVRVVDYMGNDSAIVQAARVSYGEGTKSINQDRGLIRYLMKNNHTSPFEMCEIKLHVKLPIFVARQWIRHRTANVNEYSARYSIVTGDYYVPAPENIRSQSTMNKQQSGESVSDEYATNVISNITDISNRCYDMYTSLLDLYSDTGTGVSREISRIILGVNYYTEWYWKIDLHNLLHFLKLRCDSHAQYEIREYAKAILDIVRLWVPLTYEAFMDYRMNSYTLSSQAREAVRELIRGKPIADINITPKEMEELMRDL